MVFSQLLGVWSIVEPVILPADPALNLYRFVVVGAARDPAANPRLYMNFMIHSTTYSSWL